MILFLLIKTSLRPYDFHLTLIFNMKTAVFRRNIILLKYLILNYHFSLLDTLYYSYSMTWRFFYKLVTVEIIKKILRLYNAPLWMKIFKIENSEDLITKKVLRNCKWKPEYSNRYQYLCCRVLFYVLDGAKAANLNVEIEKISIEPNLVNMMVHS